MISRLDHVSIIVLAAGILAAVPSPAQQLKVGEAEIEVTRPDQTAARRIMLAGQPVDQMLEISLDKKVYFVGVPVEPGDYSLLLAEVQGKWAVALNKCGAASPSEECSQASEVLRTLVKAEDLKASASQPAFIDDGQNLSIVVGAEAITLPIAAPLSTLWLCGTHTPEHGARNGKERLELTQRYQCTKWHQ